MFRSLSNSWALVKASIRVLQADKELMLFPVVSGIALLLVSISFFVPTYLLLPGLESGETPRALAYAIGFLFYVVQYFVIIYFQTGLVGAAMIRLNGGDPTVKDGLRIANERLGVILSYALIAATVGMILRALRERLGFVGGLISALGGFAWSLATFFVVPVLAAKKVGPFDAISESAALLKKTWGEQLAGGGGIGLVFGLLMFGYIVFIGVVFALVASLQSTAIYIALSIAAVVGFLGLILVSSTLGGIYSAALYRFAQDGSVNFFDRELLREAFHRK